MEIPQQPKTEPRPITPDEERKLKLQMAKTHAVGEAMREVMSEQRFEIIKRARAKLTAMGIQLADEEVP